MEWSEIGRTLSVAGGLAEGACAQSEHGLALLHRLGLDDEQLHGDAAAVLADGVLLVGVGAVGRLQRRLADGQSDGREGQQQLRHVGHLGHQAVDRLFDVQHVQDLRGRTRSTTRSNQQKAVQLVRGHRMVRHLAVNVREDEEGGGQVERHLLQDGRIAFGIRVGRHEAERLVALPLLARPQFQFRVVLGRRHSPLPQRATRTDETNGEYFTKENLVRIGSGPSKRDSLGTGVAQVVKEDDARQWFAGVRHPLVQQLRLLLVRVDLQKEVAFSLARQSRARQRTANRWSPERLKKKQTKIQTMKKRTYPSRLATATAVLSGEKATSTTGLSHCWTSMAPCAADAYVCAPVTRPRCHTSTSLSCDAASSSAWSAASSSTSSASSPPSGNSTESTDTKLCKVT